ncbi:MAG: lamin tail domain-containing protein [Planctomycetota bacterium]
MSRFPLDSSSAFAFSALGLFGLSSPLAAQVSTPGLVINEVCLGGQSAQFIELRNSSASPISFSGVVLDTAAGSFALGSAPSLAPGQHFLILQAPASELGISGDGRTFGIASAPAHVMKDTVLLRRGHTILDAVAYGTSKDSSIRYTQAVRSGQLANGTFVNTSNSFTGLDIGRSQSGADTNNLSADWALHGGKDSYGSSPRAENNATMTGEKETVQHFQEQFNQICLNVLGFDVDQADHLSFAAGNPSTTAHLFQIASTDYGAQVLAGTGTDQFVALGNGQYDIVSAGTFASGAMQIAVSIKDSVRATSLSRSLDVVLTTPDGHVYDYKETDTSLFSGAWGNFSINHTRDVVAWDGIKRSTSSTQAISWPAANLAASACTSTLSLARSFPPNPATPAAYQAWVDAGSSGTPPSAPYTTEKVSYVANLSATPGHLGIVFSNYQIDHGVFGQATQDNCTFDLDLTSPTDLTASYSYDFVGPVSASIDIGVTGTLLLPSQDIVLDGALSRDGVQALTYAMYIDPLRGPALLVEDGDWWEWTKWGVATFVTGAACGLGTAVAAGATIVVGTVTVGTGVPVGAAGTAAAAGACAVATTFVGNSLWPD